MWKLLLWALIIAGVFKLAILSIYAAAFVVGIVIVFKFLRGFFRWLRGVYHFLNPESKERSLARQEIKKKELTKFAKQQAENQQVEMARRAEQQRAEMARLKIQAFEKERAAQSIREEAESKERARKEHRDADAQITPYVYQTGKHANEALAIRYGIANQESRVKEFTYFAKGGVKTRNPDRDTSILVPSEKIAIRKTKYLGNDQYLAVLSDHGDREVRVVIEKGTEYVKTFLPLKDAWFEKHAELETALKHNSSFTLKELASFHVQKAVP